MELRHLRVFVAVSDELHFGRAAARLRVAQSAVSQTIKDLETELGVELFHRRNRRVELSAAGREMLASSEAAFAELDAGASAARRVASGAQGRLAVRAVMTATLTRLSPALVSYAAAQPDVALRLSFGTSEENIEALRKGACDVALVSLATTTPPPFTAAVVERSRVALLVRADHRLARRRTVKWEEIADVPMILLKEAGNPNVRRQLRQKFEAAGIRPRVVLEVDQLEAMLSLVEAGLGVSIAPQYVGRAASDRVRAVPIEPEAHGGIKAIWDGERPSPIVSRFLTLLLPKGAA